MKKTLALAAALSLAATTGCAMEMDTTDFNSTEQAVKGKGGGPTPAFTAIGASVTAGVGATGWFPGNTEVGSTALFAEYLGDDVQYTNLAEPGYTSAQIADELAQPAHVTAANARPFDTIFWLAAGGNDLLALIDPAILAPCFQPPEVEALGVSFACYDIFREATEAYEDNLRRTLKTLTRTAKAGDMTIMMRTEVNSLDEANCAIDGAIDANGDIFIPASLIPGLRQLADLSMEGNAPAIEALGFPAFEGINVKMRKVAAEFADKADIVLVESFMAFKFAALQGGDLITRDCVHPNDAGHALIRDIAVAAYESL